MPLTEEQRADLRTRLLSAIVACNHGEEPVTLAAAFKSYDIGVKASVASMIAAIEECLDRIHPEESNTAGEHVMKAGVVVILLDPEGTPLAMAADFNQTCIGDHSLEDSQSKRAKERLSVEIVRVLLAAGYHLSVLVTENEEPETAK